MSDFDLAIMKFVDELIKNSKERGLAYTPKDLKEIQDKVRAEYIRRISDEN